MCTLGPDRRPHRLAPLSGKGGGDWGAGLGSEAEISPALLAEEMRAGGFMPSPWSKCQIH